MPLLCLKYAPSGGQKARRAIAKSWIPAIFVRRLSDYRVAGLQIAVAGGRSRKIGPLPARFLRVKVVTALARRIVRAPMNGLVELLHQGHVLRAMDEGLFDGHQDPAFRRATVFALQIGMH